MEQSHHHDQGECDQHGRPVKVPSVTVDALVVRPTADKGPEILLITRGQEPFKGCLATPGGFVDYNEDPEHAVIRELEEECGVKGAVPRMFTVAGRPGRDPRKHVISIFYLVEVGADAEVKAGDDAATAQWYSLRDIYKGQEQMAFDHRDIIAALIDKHYPEAKL